jgi:heme exporter protein A
MSSAVTNEALTVRAAKLGKRFGARVVFKNLEFAVSSGTVAAILGANGAGKSTLLRLVCGLMRPDAGTIMVQTPQGEISGAALRGLCGLAAPDAPLYRELTCAENLEFFAQARGVVCDISGHLERFALGKRQGDLAGDLSSGLRARLQLAVATLHTPPILLLDEPSANLDEAGRELLKRVLDEQREHGLALVATNDARDLELCDERIWVVRNGEAGARHE